MYCHFCKSTSCKNIPYNDPELRLTAMPLNKIVKLLNHNVNAAILAGVMLTREELYQIELGLLRTELEKDGVYL